MIKIFFHVAAMNHFGAVKNELFCAMKASGLYDAADEINIVFAKDKNIRLILPDGGNQLPCPKKAHVIKESTLKEYEFPTLRAVWDRSKDEDQILYIHTKGVSNPGWGGYDTWREYMTWGCIERWKDCLKELETHDTCGVLLLDKCKKWARKCGANKFYAGNFWWARGDYIRKLAMPECSPNRWLAEGWIMTGNPKAACLHNLSGGKEVTAMPSKSIFTFDGIDRRAWDDTMPKETVRVKSRMEIINGLIAKRGYKSYCEIGVRNFACYKFIKCIHKVCIDPAVPKATYPITSDDYFQKHNDTFDIFFIDGLHTAEQVEKDILNALSRLNPGGAIVVHDCGPETEWEQRDIADYDGNGVWVGTVWKTFAKLRMTRSDLRMAVIDTDYGCGIIERGLQETFPEHEITYPFFVKNRKQLMNVIEPEDYYTWIK